MRDQIKRARISRNQPHYSSKDEVRILHSNTTITLDESDRDSVIVETPSKARGGSMSEDSIIFVEKKPQVLGKRRKLSSIGSMSDADSSVIIDEPPTKRATTSKNEPEIQTEYYSLKTVIYFDNT